MTSYDIVVIGGGISGLSAAYGLQRGGRRVLLVEANERVGGAMYSVRTPDGYVLDCGPNTVAGKEDRLWQQFAELGIDGERVLANVAGAKRYLVHDGRPTLAPSGPIEALTTPLISAGARLRILGELLTKPGRGDDETVAAFFTRHIGREPTERLVDVFVGGVYAGDPAQASVKALFPSLWAADQRAGSLLRGMIAARKAARASAPPQPKVKRPRVKSQTFSFRNGLDTWAKAIGRALGPDGLWLNSRARSLQPAGGEWELVIERDGRSQLVQAGQVVLATPAYASAELVAGLDSLAAAALRSIPYAPMAMVHLGFNASDIARPLEGYGALCPYVEGHRVLGILYSSSLFNHRAPAGSVLTTTFVGGARFAAEAQLDDADMLDMVRMEHAALLGITARPAMHHIKRWPRAMPQYNLGHTERIAAVAQLEQRHPGLFLIGSYRDGLSVPKCWQNGTALADRMLAAGVGAGVRG